MIYLDTLASFPLLPEVSKEMLQSFEKDFANPSASHLLGEKAKDAIEEVRVRLADSIDALPSEIIFTSGATESNNLILKSYVDSVLNHHNSVHIITSKIEHKCVLSIFKYLESKGCEVTYLSPDENGIIPAERLLSELREETVLVSLMHVNNELGTINPIREYGKVCFDRGILFHTDVAQSYQKIPINVDDDFIDGLSISAHKIGGPKGIGAAYIRGLRNRDLQPVIHGAGQESGMRGGTLPTPLIRGFGQALDSFSLKYEDANFLDLKTKFLCALRKENVSFQGNGGANTLSSSLSLTLEGVDVDGLIRSTLQKYSLSQSSACSAGSIEPSHVLTALGFDREKAENTLRLSFSFETKVEDLLELASDIKRFAN